MANVRWIGGAAATADVWTVTPGGTTANEDFTVSVGTRSITVTAGGSDTVAQIVDKLVAAWEAAAEDYTEFAELTPTDSTTHMTLTGTTAGVAYVVTSSASGSATCVSANTSPATGPNHWNEPTNFDGGALPTTGDSVYIENTSNSILYGLEANTDTFALLEIAANVNPGFTIGLPSINAAGYPEYRPQYLYAEATECRIGRGEGQGSSRIKIDFGAIQTAVHVVRTGTSQQQGLPPCLLIGTHADNELYVGQNANVGVAFHGGEAATFKTVSSAGTLYLGDGCTLTTVTCTGGTLRRGSNCTTHAQFGGTSTIDGSATATTLTIQGGTCRYNSTGTTGTVNLGGTTVTAILDCTADQRARTFTTFNLLANSILRDPNRTITYTNGIAWGGDTREIQAA